LARLRDVGGLDGILTAIAKVEASAFLTGRTPRGNGHERWQCTFDFFLKEQSFTKIMEGQYDDRQDPPEGPGAGPSLFGRGGRGGGIAAAAAELERRLEEHDSGQPQPGAE